MTQRQGPLAGLRVVEFAGIGPAPFACMLLADLGADVVRVSRTVEATRGGSEIFDRGKRALPLDLKQPEGRDAALALIASADVLIEGFRPGVMERLGLGPAAAMERNPKLVYGRMTGWGQTGPLSQTAGHDIGYIALTGALHAIGRANDPPPPPLNLVGDFGGGSLYLAFGVCAAVIEARASGKGQVVDCAIADGAASLMTMMYGMFGAKTWSDQRDANLLDGGAWFYDTYACADGKFIAVGAIEPQFRAEFLARLELEGDLADSRAEWPDLSARLAARFKQRTRDEWAAIFEGSDACVAPVLSLTEAPEHAHNRARATFVESAGVIQPAPAPRFSRTPGKISSPPPNAAASLDELLSEWEKSESALSHT